MEYKSKTAKICSACAAQQKRNKLKINLVDLLFLLLVIFAIIWGALMYGYGEQLKREKPAPAVAQQPPTPEESALEKELKELVSGYPIERMLPQIVQQDPRVAAYLHPIAKKESNWGKRSPKQDGKDCFNYWGYRGPENTTRSGYSCFKNHRQAVAVVGGRIGKLLSQNIDTPDKMRVWKCGRDCSGHAAGSVDKWIADVGYYYRKIYN